MSYIEEKYNKSINEIFNELIKSEQDLTKLFKKRSLNVVDKVAQICAYINKEINLILKKYYPEIKKMDYKVEIKSVLKFYFDLLDKLIDFVRHCEKFDKLDDNYYRVLQKFLEDKDLLISGKYRDIVTRELTSFYDRKTREDLEKIISQKLTMRNREYFTFGTIEEELKKIALSAGADSVQIIKPDERAKELMNSAKSMIQYYTKNEKIETQVITEIQEFLSSKNYLTKIYKNTIITNANLIFDNDKGF